MDSALGVGDSTVVVPLIMIVTVLVVIDKFRLSSGLVERLQTLLTNAGY